MDRSEPLHIATSRPGERPSGAADVDARERYLSRELSWLDFNERVLDLAMRRSLPLLERTKFLAIFSGNLDEFFQVRVGGLKMQIEAGVAHEGVDESPKQRLRMISE